MSIGIGNSEMFAWRGGPVRPAPAPAPAARRRAGIRRQGGDEAAIARRFQPRLAAGFGDGDPADDGLEAFDRTLGANPLGIVIRGLLGL